MTMNKEQLTNLLDTCLAEDLTTRRAAADELRSLLTDDEQPDRAQVLSLVETLGLTVQDLPGILECVTDLAEAERLVAELDDRKQAVREASLALNGVDSWAEQEHKKIDQAAEEKRCPLQQQLGQARAKERQATNAKSRLFGLQARWRSIAEGISEDQALRELIPREIPYGGKVGTVRTPGAATVTDHGPA